MSHDSALENVTALKPFLGILGYRQNESFIYSLSNFKTLYVAEAFKMICEVVRILIKPLFILKTRVLSYC